MPISMKLEANNTAVFEVSQKLSVDEYQQIQAEIGHVIQKLGQIKLLIKLVDFSGWVDTDEWGDISSVEQKDSYIKKMAIVGSEQWRDMAEIFTLKGLRSVPIEYFVDTRLEQARNWLDAD